MNVAFWEYMERRIVEEFANSPRRDDTGRRELQNMLATVRQMKAYYQQFIDAGKIARKRLSGPQNLKERWQRFR